MTYNSYSNYQRMHSLSSHSCMDGVPMAISESFKPPPRIKLPRMPTRHVCDVIEQEYDFSLERAVLAEAESRRTSELAEQEESRLSSAMQDVLSPLDPSETVPKDSGKQTAQKSEPPAWTLGPEILTPTPMCSTKEIVKGPVRSQIRVKDFETVGDPFDDLELKVLDDMAELKSVLDEVQQRTSPTQQSTSAPDVEELKYDHANTSDNIAGVPQTSIEIDDNGRLNVNIASHVGFVEQSIERVQYTTSSVPSNQPILSSSQHKPVNSDDYNLSNSAQPVTTSRFRDDDQRTVTDFIGVNLGHYANDRNVINSFPLTDHHATTADNDIGPLFNGNSPLRHTNIAAVISSKSETFRKPVLDQNGTSAVIGEYNGTHTVIGPVRSWRSELGISACKMRNARSASDLRKLGNGEDRNQYSQSPPPRIPANPTRSNNGGRYSLAAGSTSQHPSVVGYTNQRSVTSLPDPFTSLTTEERDFVAMFVDMGFPRERTARAVQVFGRNAKQVTDYMCLCDGLVEQGYPADRVELAAQLADNQTEQVEDYLRIITQLQELGFKQSDIHKALRLHQTDTDKCLDYLTAST